MFLIRKFLDKDLPIMAICRGLQLANVYLGGTLRQNVTGHDRVGGKDVFHKAEFYGELEKLFGYSGYINSAHHQCTEKLGRGITVTAVSEDGVVEGFSCKNLHAYQFHPERLCLRRTNGGKIFSAFYKKYFS